MIKNSMTKKSLIITLVAVLVFTMCTAGFALAASESELRNDLDNVEAAQDELSKKMAQIEKDVKEMQKKVDNLNYMINQTTTEINTTEEKIVKKESFLKSVKQSSTVYPSTPQILMMISSEKAMLWISTA